MNKKDSVLEPVEAKISLKNEKAFDPKEYYQDRKGLWVSSSFETRILDNAKEVKAGKEFSIASFTLKENALDKAIEAALPKKHIFDEGELCAIIAALIAQQSKGQKGNLLNTGDWNIFYTEACGVYVRWYAGSAEWHVSAWYRDGSEWNAGHRVFSPVN